jgi:hypothetical protein
MVGGGGGPSSAVLTSLDNVKAQRTAARFELTLRPFAAAARGEQPPYEQQHAYWLCWVSCSGTLHHFYQVKLGGQSHMEDTYVGDAFVVLCSTKGSPPPELSCPCVHALCEANDVHVVCSFVSLEVAEQQEVFAMEVVVVESEEQCAVRSCTVESLPIPCEEYRIIVELPRKQRHMLRPYTEDWTLEYQFVVPKLPPKDTFDPKRETIYVWGDLSFDQYDAEGEFPLHPCLMNQIVPQVMCGHCLTTSSNDGTYAPGWMTHPTWVMQAQYFWMGPLAETDSVNSRDHALCGEFHKVDEGDRIHTTIHYSAQDGSLDVTIQSSGGKKSHILSKRPFPHMPDLFPSWGDFFKQAQAASGGEGPLGRACLNIEYKGNVKLAHLRHLAPFEICRLSFPQTGFEDCAGHKEIHRRLFNVTEVLLSPLN